MPSDLHVYIARTADPVQGDLEVEKASMRVFSTGSRVVLSQAWKAGLCGHRMAASFVAPPVWINGKHRYILAMSQSLILRYQMFNASTVCDVRFVWWAVLKHDTS